MRSQSERMTLVETILPEMSLLVDLTLILGGSVLVAFSAQVSIPLPWTPVPITGQTFGVLLVGALLGSWRGALSLLTYLAEGAAGLPVFAGGSGGFLKLFGPSGGYLWGFVAGAFVVGFLAERGWDRHIFKAALAMLAGNVVIYLFGLPWLARFLPSGHVLAAGLYPFIPGDLIKLLLAASALPSGWWALQRIRGERGAGL